nr:hypothetical protein [Tanacetum cinerariifolium]
MESLSPQVVAVAKLPILNPNEFDLWKIRIEHYFLMTDSSLWEVILNGDSPTPTRIVDGVVQVIAPTTAEQRLAKKNELKARGTLLMAFPNKHQLKFNIHKDAKPLIGQLTRVSVVPSVSAASTKVLVSTLPNVDSLSNVVIYSFFASQSNNPQLENDDLKQIDADYLEKMDLKWQMAMLTMGARRRGRFARDCISLRDNRNKDTPRRTVPVAVSTSNALVSQCDGVGSYDWSFQADEEPTNYALMAFTSLGSSSSSGSDNEVVPCFKTCSKAYATLQSQYDKLTVDFRKSQFDVLLYKPSLQSVKARLVVYQQNENVFEEDIKLLKLDVMLRENALVELKKKFEKAEKERDELKLTLDKFQTSSKNLSKLLESQITNKIGLGYDNHVFDSTVFDCDELNIFESDESVCTSPMHDRYKSGEGYHTVPPPYTGNFMPSKPDLTSDSEDEFKPESVSNQKEPSFVQTSKHVKTPRASVKTVEHHNQAKNLRTDNQKCRGHKHRWNRKACFVCKSLNHLIIDCDYYEKQMVKKPVWNHAMRVNHKNSTKMTHPHTNRHVVPTTVLTRSCIISLNAASPISTVVPQTTVKSPRLVKHVVNKAHSLLSKNKLSKHKINHTINQARAKNKKRKMWKNRR